MNKEEIYIHYDSHLFFAFLLQESCVSVLTRNALSARGWIKHVRRLAFKVYWTIVSTKAQEI